MTGPVIGVDIGGTKAAAGVVDLEGVVLDRRLRETPSKDGTAQDLEDAVVGMVSELADGYEVEGIGIGAAGFVDSARQRVLFAPHLVLRGEPLAERVSARTRLPVVVENDATAAAWAEARFGAAREERSALCVTLGTGIGGGIVLDGVLQRGAYGLAGEFGHMVVVPGGHRCQCGNRGCWEQYASGNALEREARELVRTGSVAASGLVAASNGDPDAVTGPLVTRLAREGDRTCAELLGEAGQWLGTGLANLAAAFDPAIFVIGGGVADAGDLLLEPARVAFTRSLTGRGFRPEARIVRAELGNDAGMVGAADLARTAVRP